MMQAAVSSYSFSKLLQTGTLTQLGCIQKAKEMGFDAIEFVGIQPHDGSGPAEYALRLREECERCGLPISCYTVGADFLTGSGGDLQAEIARVQQEVEIAALLGAPLMRHDATSGYPQGQRKYRGFSDALPTLVEGCRQVTDYSAERGVRTMVENHGTFCQDSDRVERLINAVARENFGWLVDMGNFLCADEAPATAVGKAAPYAFYVHAKDFHVKSPMGPAPGRGFFCSRNGTWLRGAIVGHGEVPVRHCLTALKRAGYDGFVAIEFEGMEEPLEALAIGLENLRAAIGSLECI